MKNSEIIQKYQALSAVYHGAGADPVALKMYEAGYAALAEAIGGMETLNRVTAEFAAGTLEPDPVDATAVDPVPFPGVVPEGKRA